MKILIFSHGTFYGGAEKALLDLIDNLCPQHSVAIIFPDSHGQLVEICRNKGLEVGFMPLGLSLPTPANFLLDFYRLNLDAYLKEFSESNYDLVISNTLATLQGILFAQMLNLPCLVYAHEYLLPKEGLSPHGCSAKFYLKLYFEMASHILCASEYVKSSFGSDQESKLSVLYPFKPYEQPILKSSSTDAVSLLVIGGKLIRKNTHFAILVLKALRLRGVPAELHIVGVDGDGSFKLDRQAQIRQEKHVFISHHHPDPFTIGGSRKINLICALNEPFGLTMAESLSCGIPVVASKCGGPQEMLTEEFLFDVNDLDQCVRAIENILSDYDHYSELSKFLYDDFIKNHNNLNLRKEVINQAVNLAMNNFKKAPVNTQDFWENIKNLLEQPISKNEVLSSIAMVSQKTQNPLSIAEVDALVEHEKNAVGSAVLKDVLQFDVVPFAHSKNMDRLYAGGIGLAIELTAWIDATDKKKILSYILLALEEKQQSQPNSKLKILFLGDGMGLDSIHIGLAGYDIDYLDFENSLMGDCAKLNFDKAKEKHGSLSINFINEVFQTYDAVITLEVIEHVPNPKDFIAFINGCLKEQGIVFITEFFHGIYDPWPTHLYNNENYSFSLPLLMAPYFELVDVNIDPLAKPYFFQKRSALTDEFYLMKLFEERAHLNEFIQTKLRLGY